MMTLGWMRVATIAGAVAVILGMTFLMAFTMWLAFVVRLWAGTRAWRVAVVSFWLAYEFATLNINIITPWINLGNGLAGDILFIQWYEFTGTGGGTLWILLSNLVLAGVVDRMLSGSGKPLAGFALWIALVLIPSAASLARYHTVKTSGNEPSEVIIAQPNTDPYSEKFRIPFDVQLDRIAIVTSGFVTPSTDWVILPETVADDPVDLMFADENLYIRILRRIALRNPGSSVVAGLVTRKAYPLSDDPPTRSARMEDESGTWYDYYNSALRIDTGSVLEVYHKSKLVPGIEMQFSNGPGRLAARILPYLGGTKWGYGIQDERSVFTHPRTGISAAPVICYESVFGSYVGEYVRNGAAAIFIITNDGWWKNTGGYRHHLAYASLRAIETRRPVARSANTGVSCIINIRGEREEELEWWTEGVIRGKITPETAITPYVKYGDIILKIAVFISVLVLSAAFITGRRRQN
jgi:apolipoprotein N-acyltransferase